MRTRSVRRSACLLIGLLLAGWGALGGPSVRAQPAGPSDPSIPLTRALQRLSTSAEVSLVYDASLVRGHTARCPVTETAPETALRCLLSDTGLDFVQTSAGTYVIKRDVRRPPRTGTVTGVVWDRQRGGPLPRAHVRAPDGNVGTVSDAEGRFRLAGLTAGPHTLVVSRLGYERKTVELSVRPGRTVRDTVALALTSIALDPVVVDAASTPELGPSRGHDTLPAGRLSRPGPLGTPSVAHAAGRLMGVSTSAPYADLHVQGSASGDHEVRLDGAPVRNPTTVGRLVGGFSPLALDDLTARKAGFGALRGDVLSGVVGLEHDLDRPDAHYATLRVDPVGLNGRADGSVALGETNVQLMGAGRLGLWDVHRARSLTSLIDTWSVLDPVLTAAQLSADTSLAEGSFAGRRARPRSRFHDAHAAARLEFGPARRLYVSAYHGASMLGADLVFDPETAANELSVVPEALDGEESIQLPTSDHYEWTNTLAQARYETPLADRTTGTVQAFLSRYRASSHFEVGRLQRLPPSLSSMRGAAGSRASNAVTELGLQGTVDVSWAERSRLTLTGGLTSLGTRVDLTNAFVGAVRHDTRRTRITTAGEAQMGLGPHLTLDGGLRLTVRPPSGGLYAEPRAALRYRRAVPGLGDVALRVGGGLYRQFTTRFGLARDGATAVVPSTQVWAPLPPSLEPPRSYHLASSLSWRPGSAWTVGAEGYLKWQPHLLAVDYPAITADPGASSLSEVLSASRGRAVGGGVHVSYDGALGRGTLRYSRSRSRRTFPGRFDGRRVPTPWTEPHRLTLEGRVPLGDVLSVDLRSTGIWGRRWGYRRSYYAYLRAEAPDRPADRPDLGRPSDHRLPPLYRIDATLVAEHAWGDVSVTGRIGLLNVLGRANVADWGLRPDDSGSVRKWARTLPGRRSIVSLQIRY